MTEDTFKKIKAFAFDVDGVMTDGGLLACRDGEFLRSFDSKDGFAIRMAIMKGYPIGVITGGRSISITRRFAACGVPAEDIYLGSRDKIEDFEDFCSRHGLKDEDVMYFGDDLPDIPVMVRCGCGVAPSDAVDEVKEIADFVSPNPGGKRCVRDTLERVMTAAGVWALDVSQYKKTF